MSEFLNLEKKGRKLVIAIIGGLVASGSLAVGKKKSDNKRKDKILDLSSEPLGTIRNKREIERLKKGD